MKVGLFGNDRDPFTDAAQQGLAAVEAVQVVRQIPSGWSTRQARVDFDAVVLIGNRGRCGEAGKFYRDRGLKVLMVDQPHLGRGSEPQQYRVSLADHSWLPGAGSLDRLEALEVSGAVAVSDPHQRSKGQKILVCGQRRGDRTHGMSNSAFRAWAEAAIGKCKSLDDSKVIWRPHPLDVYQVVGADLYSDPRNETLDQAMADVWMVVVYSSNAGLQALMAGKRVVSDYYVNEGSQTATGKPVYAELCGRFSRWKDVKAPKPDELRSLLARIAYAQWTAEEIATGDPFRPFLEAQPEPEAEPEPDDFTAIKNIGPSSHRSIVASGIKTFEELCALDPKDADTLGLSQTGEAAIRRYLGETSEPEE